MPDLPGHIFQQLLDGKIDGYEAGRRAREYDEHARANGGDMNSRVREALTGRVPIGRARYQAARDAQGRFTGSEGATEDMNALIRLHARGVPSPQGTVEASSDEGLS
jgi:hypothetical protein